MNVVELAKLKKMVGSGNGGGGTAIELDTTLTKHGKAADAKATGDAINRLANETTLSSSNTIKLTPIKKGKIIDVIIAPDKNNALTAVEGGLLVPMPIAGDGIDITNNIIGVKLSDTAHGLVAVNGALSIKLATKESAGAMSASDKIILDSLPDAYVARKYDISNTPIGTLVHYDDHEIRIMCPVDADFNSQNSNTDTYYITFKAYAPTEAVSFKHGDRGVIIDEMHNFDGVDELNRKYTLSELLIATYNATTGTWTYYGKNSTESKYIGWDYVVEWFNDKGIKIGFDAVRINLSNELCHYNNKPYYMTNYATTEDIAEIKEITSNVEKTYIWGEI